MKKTAICLLLFFSLFSSVVVLSQTQSNNSLLWRVTGNGLTKPSYLFGTMHVYDKKAFNFKDSLYSFLEQAEGFALEFNPDSANMVIEAYMNGSVRAHRDEDQDMDISSSDLKAMQKKMPGEKSDLVKEDKKSMVDYFIARLLASDKKQKDAMNTFMDAFLYQMAKQYDKRMFGLEAMTSQIEALGSLSKGLKTKKFVNLLDKWDPEEESPIAELYYRENIDSINIFFTTYFTEASLNGFLYERNKVMAAKMDSLMRLQSMFTAVGAAHLPGDKGIIALLKQRGYTIEPVFSSRKILAAEYKINNVDRPRYVVTNDQMGLEYEMPGKPNNQDGEAGRLVTYYYDLGGGTLYMTICGKTSSKDRKSKSEGITTTELDEVVSRMDGKILSSKVVTIQGLKGLEILCLAKGNTYCRMYELLSKNMFYIFYLAAAKKDNLYTTDAEKYLASFKPIPIPATQWTAYEFPEDGFKVLLPGKPKIEPLKTAPNSGPVNSYSYFDANSGVNYIITSGKTKEYSEYFSNSTFFENYLENVHSSVDKEGPTIIDTLVSGFPGKEFIRPSETNVWKGLVIKRDHTSFFIVAEFEPGAGEEQVEKFLQSFSFINFRAADWQLKNSPAADFSAWVPSEIRQKEHDSTETYYVKPAKQYYAYDPYSALTYYIDAEPISKYYWAPSEDSVYSYWKNKALGWNDSLLSYTTIKNGGITGRELTYFSKSDSSTIKQRLLLSGQTMYSVHMKIPGAFADKPNLELFFQNFRITEEKKSAEILNNSPDKLFADLTSTDSATFQHAYDALSEVKFERDQLMLLMEKSLIEYPVGRNYQTVNHKLLSIADDLFQSAEPAAKREVIAFIENNYPKPDKTIEEIRFPFLELIAKDKTSGNFELIRKLLTKKLPSKGADYLLFRKLEDSLSLTKILYPELLQYIADTTMGVPVAALTRQMLDSGMISIDVVRPAKNDLLKLARRQLKYVLRADVDDGSFDYRVTELIALLAMMKQKETDDLVTEFLKAKIVSIKKEAALALIKNNKPVSPLTLKQVASDKYERAYFYNELDKLNKTNLFPVDFRSQQKLAESYIYQYLVDGNDGEPIDAELIYIKKIEDDYKGEKKRFYFFRVNYPQEDADSTEMETTEPGSNSYLAIAGPFEVAGNKLTIEDGKNITGLYYDEKFDGLMMDDYFRKFIEERSKWGQ